MATIAEVAQKAGVSVATVSRVLNNSMSVKSDTADKVKQAIEELDYVPNLSARNLRRNESRIVLILAPNFTNPYYAHILSGISDTANKLGYNPLIINTRDAQAMKEEDIVARYHNSRADGMILLACNYDDTWINRYYGEFPIVQCSEYVENTPIPHISVDNYKAAYELVTKLIEVGHRRIAIIGSKNKYMSTKLRYQGYCDALRDAGIKQQKSYAAMGDVDYSFESGQRAAAALLGQKKPPTAIFCVSDVMALGAIAEAQDRGIRVPKELSVAGFDDVDYTTMFHPHLTTAKIPCYELGYRAMKLLAQCMRKEVIAQSSIYLPHTLMFRESVVTPPGVGKL